jgi:hypothetical protein
MDAVNIAVGKIEQGIFDLIRTSGSNNVSLIHRAEILQSLQTLLKTILLFTQRRLTGKLNASPEIVIQKAFDKFACEIRGATK